MNLHVEKILFFKFYLIYSLVIRNLSFKSCCFFIFKYLSIILRCNMINLNELSLGLPAITKSFGAALAEAGAVCFESEGHVQGDIIEIKGDYNNSYKLSWPQVTQQTLKCWNDPEVTTEHGAVGVAVLLAKKEIGYNVIERSRKGTGFDYWLGDDEINPFQNKARLEISGIRNGSDNQIRSRVKQKKNQTNPSDRYSLPAFIIVVEFGNPIAEVHKK